MDQDQLRQLLTRKEGPKLDFKQEMYKIQKGEAHQEYQKHELIKDILALANGNPSHAWEEGHLVIGVADELDADGKRVITGVDTTDTDDKQITQMVNSACSPKISNIRCDHIPIEGKQVLVISIPRTPHILETIKPLKTKERIKQNTSGQGQPGQEKLEQKNYSEHVVFIRLGETTNIASYKDREALQRMKSFYATESIKVSPVLFGAIVAITVGGLLSYTFATIDKNTYSTIIAKTIVGTFFALILGASIGYCFSNFKQIRNKTYSDPWYIQIFWIALALIIGLLISTIINFFI